MAVWAARRELADCAGGQFDPEIVRAFLSISLPKLLWRTGPVSLLVQLPFLARLQEVGLSSVTAMTQGVAAATVAAGVTAMVVAGPTGASAHGHHHASHGRRNDVTVVAPSPTAPRAGSGRRLPGAERPHTGAGADPRAPGLRPPMSRPPPRDPSPTPSRPPAVGADTDADPAPNPHDDTFSDTAPDTRTLSSRRSRSRACRRCRSRACRRSRSRACRRCRSRAFRRSRSRSRCALHPADAGDHAAGILPD